MLEINCALCGKTIEMGEEMTPLLGRRRRRNNAAGGKIVPELIIFIILLIGILGVGGYLLYAQSKFILTCMFCTL